MTRKISIILLIFNSVSALFGGAALIADPTGEWLGMGLQLLEGSPFADFLIPGIVLFIIPGIGSALAAYSVVSRKKKYYLDIITIGIVFTVWIVVQVKITGSFHFLHALYGGLGLALIALGTAEKKSYVEKVGEG